MGNIHRYKDQLSQFLDSYIKDLARNIADACGEHNVLDAWRQLAERGHSWRPSHIKGLMKKAMWPRDAVASKDLEQAIANLEKDVQLWEDSSGEQVLLAHRKLALEEKCPERFRAHLRIPGPEKIQTYEAMRVEIADWLLEEHRKLAKQRANLCE